jgi:hypothetical protein
MMKLRRTPISPSALDLLLGDRRLFGDGPPNWTITTGQGLKKPCPTNADTEALRESVVRRLRTHRKRTERSGTVAERLMGCCPRVRCGSGACPACARALKRWFVEEAIRLVEDYEAPFMMITLVPDTGRISFDALSNALVRRLWRQTCRRLKDHGIGLAFGGLDISLNAEKPTERQWTQPHFTLFIPRCMWTKAESGLRRTVGATGTAHRPLNAREFDGNPAGLAYALKYEFSRRDNIVQPAKARRNAHRNTRQRPIQGKAFAELAVALDRIGLDSRLALLGVKRRMINGGTRLILTSSVVSKRK